eukprot:CAMPEP_0194492312 /NCGR_PEP_ID=MMETSP0253-20130528/10914_1 /TAXON_ID=2966 /ORGANISM="Noctiluca scintillans" /LENGTH=325 /DNA_ID=CAMNT_0039333161 /DNA_START=61 /DNA_END=1038 /DNA_ORIENTATION=-
MCVSIGRVSLFAALLQPCVTGLEIVVGTFQDTFHQAEAAVIVNMLRSRGYVNATLSIGANHSAVFDGLWSGNTHILPSVWLPSGHASFVAGHDYVQLGTTSEEGVFYWAASPAAVAAGVRSIDDLADVSKTAGFETTIYGAAPGTGLSIASSQIVAALNAKRTTSDPAAPLFEYVPDFESNVAFLDEHQHNETMRFVSALWLPFWGYQRYVVDGTMTRLSSGTVGAPAFGLPNRGVTLVAPSFLKSGLLDDVTLGVLASMFIGNSAIAVMDESIYSNHRTPIDAALESALLPENNYWFEVYRDTSTPLHSEGCVSAASRNVAVSI